MAIDEMTQRSPRHAFLMRILLCGVLACVSVSCAAQDAKPKTKAKTAKQGTEQESAESGEIGVLHVKGNVYMLVGPKSNATVQVGDEGVLVVDTLDAESSEAFIAAIKTLSDKPIRHIINTHVHADHTGGNDAVSAAGDSLYNKNYSTNDENAEDRAPIYAHEEVLNTMNLMENPPAFENWPTSTYFTESKDLYFIGEAVRLFHQPNAHTNGDSIVHFRGSDVISSGDVFIMTTYPYIDEANGGSINGIIDALNRIIEIAVPEALQENGTMIVPGHGRVCDESEVVEYRDMLTMIRNYIRERMNEGMTLEQIQETHPTSGFDPRWAPESGDWTPERFVTAIYHELSGQEKQ